MTKIRYNRGETVSYTTDSSLLRHVQQGNEDAWNRFYQKYIGMIHTIGKKRRLTPEERDELMIDVMTMFWRKMDQFIYDRNRGKFRSYLGRIADYCAMLRFAGVRRHCNAVPIDENLNFPDDVDVSFMDEWRDFILEKALDELRDCVDTETYQVFHMSFVQRCPVKDISAVTRKSANNIYVIRSRCLNKLTELVARYRQLDERFLKSVCHSQSSSCPN